MEKTVTITSCCAIFFNLHIDPKFPTAELFKITLPEPFSENYTVMQDNTVQAISKGFCDHKNWQLLKNSIRYSPVGSLQAG